MAMVTWKRPSCQLPATAIVTKHFVKGHPEYFVLSPLVITVVVVVIVIIVQLCLFIFLFCLTCGYLIII